ncbi:AlkA N-terminal domain-containing protein [Pseudonocardia xinjiangensis]|uniref:DNA-3-methyladenine glycosylase II n=1 Tax=Pseudonocardia xinjiangensis TaxID=75289 RepID=A0ABX1RPV4_9PSEU|nr:AlkA N-terminal domain-containing protein [Pseudonocardia xinjiangensis]NMH82407.1 DNA-3-methyladenine glycosylase 2 family protein [Pseudonocardia xinjiangensis]
MLLDQERCYRAVAARDARFDGQFITAVRTTGIYCRPSCPAMTPKRANVEFLPTAGAAQQRGYRACRRCQPDAVPGSPDWNIRADLAARAMRLIADGVVERDGVVGLATRLGYSERQLNRVLTAELGAGPLALSRAHRAHTARLLIETTPLTMADIAFAAGFASVRQFNDTVREVYGVPPTTLRTEAGRRCGAVPAAAGTLVLRLPYRPPFDGDGLLAFFSARALDGVESVVDGTYHRTLRLPHAAATVALDLRPTDRGAAATTGHVVATVRLGDPRDLGPAVARLRRLLDLDADPVAVDALLGADPDLAPSVAATPGIRLPGTVDGVETALRTVLGQQVSVAAARTAASRLAAALGERLPPQLTGAASADAEREPPDLLFPTAAAIAERGAEVLTGPATRIATVLRLAEAVADGSLVLDAGRDPADLRAALTALPGIGPWTAGYLAMRLLGDPDELLATDLVVRRGAAALGLPSDVDGLAARAENWKPWRSYAATHLWRTAATTSSGRTS